MCWWIGAISWRGDPGLRGLGRDAVRASCTGCSVKAQCTPTIERKVTRWEHEAVIDALQTRMDLRPRAMRERRSQVEHPFGTIKAWMGHSHFLMKRLPKVKTAIGLTLALWVPKRRFHVLEGDGHAPALGGGGCDMAVADRQLPFGDLLSGSLDRGQVEG